MDEVKLADTKFAPCPICKQYSHSIGDDQLAAAFMHFETMYSHRGDGIPTQFCFPMETRDAAQILMAAARALSPPPGAEERVARALHDHEDSWNDVAWECLPASTQQLFLGQARAAMAAMVRETKGESE